MIFLVVTVTDAFMSAAVPRDVRSYASRAAALRLYKSLRGSYLASKQYTKLMEIDEEPLKICSVRDRDGYKTSISFISIPME